MARTAPNRLYAQVASGITADIVNGAYPVGSRLPSERDLALAFGVSRPSIREAIIALEVDGMVEVRMGSGVYVLSATPSGGKSAMTGVGPFELLEARRAIEGEVCALAAARATDRDIDELQALYDAMDVAEGDIAKAEHIDRQFHVKIASISRNSAFHAAVNSLWDARLRSPQHRLLTSKAHQSGAITRAEEHLAILQALRARDPAAARGAMHVHLTRVLDMLLEATEVDEAADLRERLQQRRQRFLASG